ncbi:hypothetical protein DFJ73DRAFT_757589 [Zopfochytrium polystomum]|nr:hypothetical protein DFJ73DRAFT_757589 [Zopfochytrium polystomum]
MAIEPCRLAFLSAKASSGLCGLAGLLAEKENEKVEGVKQYRSALTQNGFRKKVSKCRARAGSAALDAVEHGTLEFLEVGVHRQSESGRRCRAGEGGGRGGEIMRLLEGGKFLTAGGGD